MRGERGRETGQEGWRRQKAKGEQGEGQLGKQRWSRTRKTVWSAKAAVVAAAPASCTALAPHTKKPARKRPSGPQLAAPPPQQWRVAVSRWGGPRPHARRSQPDARGARARPPIPLRPPTADYPGAASCETDRARRRGGRGRAVGHARDPRRTTAVGWRPQRRQGQIRHVPAALTASADRISA